VKTKTASSTPLPQPIGEAIDGSAALSCLREALRDSARRLEVVRPAIPRPLLAHVKAGPVDAEGWSLLAANASVAAKLRQMVPHLETMLREAGWAVTTIRIKVAAGG